MVKLFIVPWLWAGTVSANGSESARKRTSTIRCDVSTFPAATAPGGRGQTKLPSLASTRNARREPAFRGASGSVRHRMTYEAALRVTANGAFRLPATWRSVPSKSTAIPEPPIVTSA